MKSSAVLLAGAIALAFPNAAIAKDDDWSGAYVGVNAGVTQHTTENIDNWCWAACDAPIIKDDKLSVGATIGVNAQVDPSFVVGLEADISTAGSKAVITPSSRLTTPPPVYTWTADYKWSSSVRLRAGMANGPTLFYVTGGFALARAEFDQDSANYPPYGTRPGPFGANWSGTISGFAYGVGVEHRFGNFSVKAELLHSTFKAPSACFADRVGPQTGVCITEYAADPPTVTFNPSLTAGRVGINYRF